MKRQTLPLLSYGRCAKGKSRVFYPVTVDDVHEVFAVAAREGRRVVIRGGGHSFDSQALHDGDTGREIVLCTSQLKTESGPDIQWYPGTPHKVRLAARVKWITFLEKSMACAGTTDPIRIPGSMQTAKDATAGGTLAGDCLSRFSATMGKESANIESFFLITPSGLAREITETDPLFNAVIGGHGYLGLVTAITYKLHEIPNGSCAHTIVTTHRSLKELLQKQETLRKDPKNYFHAISAAGFEFGGFKGGVFDSFYTKPILAQPHPFPLYEDVNSHARYFSELAAREPAIAPLLHLALFLSINGRREEFENDIVNFIFFMTGNAVAKERFEHAFPHVLFPVLQQTFVIPGVDNTIAFSNLCFKTLNKANIPLTEYDVLYVPSNDVLMSATYKQPGYAVTLTFEPAVEWPKGCAPNIERVLRGLSEICWKKYGGRIHPVKHVHIDGCLFREMFSPQIESFERLKRECDPEMVLQNDFSDRLRLFSPCKKRRHGRKHR